MIFWYIPKWKRTEEKEYIDRLNRGPLTRSIWLSMDDSKLYIVEIQTKWKGTQASEVHIRLKSNNRVQQTDKLAGVLRVLTDCSQALSWSHWKSLAKLLFISIAAQIGSCDYFKIYLIILGIIETSICKENACVYDSPLGSIFSRKEVPVPTSWWI